jgi:hypothetical protein
LSKRKREISTTDILAILVALIALMMLAFFGGIRL